MGQLLLIYSFVARGTDVLAQHSDFEGDYSSIAAKFIGKLPTTNTKKMYTYKCRDHTFYFLVHNEFTYCVLATEDAGWEVPYAFLEQIKEVFTKKQGGLQGDTTATRRLKKKFRKYLKKAMMYCANHPNEVLNKIAKVKPRFLDGKADEEEIKNVFDHGEQIELLVDRTKILRSQGQDFRPPPTHKCRNTCLKHFNAILIMVTLWGILLCCIAIFLLSLYGLSDHH